MKDLLKLNWTGQMLTLQNMYSATDCETNTFTNNNCGNKTVQKFVVGKIFKKSHC